MGMFDSFRFMNGNRELVEVQLKSGNCELADIRIGNNAAIYGYKDGVYFDDTMGDYILVVKNGIFLAGFEGRKISGKYGETILIKN